MKKSFSKKNLWENLPTSIKSGVGRIAGLVPTQVLLGKDFRDWLDIARSTDTWSLDEVAKYTQDQVASTCMHAFEHSSYYRSQFQQVGFDPNADDIVEELKKLPLIDKHTINQHQDGLLTVPADSRGIDYVATGGSSGEPMRFLIGSDRSAVEFAHLVCGWERIGYNVNIKQAVLRGQVINVGDHGLHHYYDPLLRRHCYSNFYMTDKDMAAYLDHISTIGPCYLHTYPSSMNMLSRFIKRTNHPIPKNIQGLLVGSENVYPEDRQNTEELFGSRYFSWYGHSEKLVFGAECEHSTDYHIAPSYGFCELVDDAGNRVTTPGERGEIVGTGYINKIMPFIRYRTGDYATYIGENCKHCQRNHLVISDVSGHNTLEMLVAKDGSLIPWAACNIHDDTFDEVLQFQFRQHEVGKATLRLVAATDKEINAEQIVSSMNSRLQARMEFDVEIVDEIPLTRNGKSVFVDQQLDTDAIMKGQN